MNYLDHMFDSCLASPDRIFLKEHQAATARLFHHLQANLSEEEFLEVEELITPCLASSMKEGFTNGWTWAQATAKECLDLRNSGLTIKIPPDLLSAAIEAMRDLQARYEADAAALASLGEAGRELAGERLESAKVALGLFNFFTEV